MDTAGKGHHEEREEHEVQRNGVGLDMGNELLTTPR
jgi:hypothetical protein